MSPTLLTMAPNHLDMLAHQHQHSPTARPAGLSGMTVTPTEAMEKAKHAVATSQHQFPGHHPQQLHHPESNNKKGKKKDSGAQLNADGEMIIVEKPGQHDVLLGRGGGTNNHGGNIRFRKLVNEHKLRYLAANKVEKPNVARDVVDIWRNLQPSGRFLARYTDGDKTEKNGPGGVKQAESLWYEVGDKRAREKASQCLRERTPEVMPYIKKIREQQDALTEEGMAIFQAQQAAQAGIKIPPFHSSNGKTRGQRGLEDISERSAPGRLDNSYAFGGGGAGNVRRNPMPSIPDAAGSGSDSHAAALFMQQQHRRSSDVTGGVRPSNAAALNSRRSSLPAPASVPSSSAFAQQQTHNIEESLYSNAAEMDYYQRCNSLLMMQQQQIEEQMLEYRMLQEQQSRYAAAAGISPRQMQMHQQQLEMRHRANGGIPPSLPKGRGHPVHLDDVEPHDHQDYFSPLPLEGEGEGAAAAAAAAAAGNRNAGPKAGRSCLKKGSSTAVAPNLNSDSGGFKHSRTANEMAAAALAAATGGKDRRSSGITSPSGPVADNNSKPETTTSAAAAANPAPVADPVDEEGEMTIEEYRRQLEEYMSKQNALDGGNQGMDDDGNDSDLEDDWEKEKEKAHREHRERNDSSKKRGVKSALSGCSFMSTETFKSNMSMLSGMSMLSEGDGENLDAILSGDGDREKKMGGARSVSSNLSLMSELTDMSQNLDELHL